MQINFKFDCEALSSNRCYKNLPRGRALTTEAKNFKQFIYTLAKNQLNLPVYKTEALPYFGSKDIWIEATYFFYSPKILTKAGSLNKNKLDVSSCIKLLQDSIFEAMGLDDYLITESSEKQMQSDKPLIFVSLKAWPLMTLNDVSV